MKEGEYLKLTLKKYKYIDILYNWLKDKKNIKVQSYQKYERLIEQFLKKDLGNIYIEKIKNSNILNFFNYHKDIGTSISTQKTLIYIIKSSLEYAYNKKMCKYIDLKELKIKSKNKTIYILSKEEQLKLELYLKEKINIRKVCLLLCLYTGLRIGEVCGLKWEDIDFNNKSLIVKRTIQRIKNKDSNKKTLLIESTPKSDSSYRIVPIPDFLIILLQKFKEKNEYFILSKSKNLYDPRLFEYFYKRVMKNCNINYINFHTLRHTFATRSIESKMDIKTLSEILGHSSIEITLKLYVHPSYEAKKISIEHLVNFMTN